MAQETNLLGIDLGKVKTGVARSEGRLSEPLLVIHETNLENLAQKIIDLVEKESADAVVIGLPQGEIEKRAKDLGEILSKKNIVVHFWDETLTTRDAQLKSIQAGIKRKKRKTWEDAFSAALMLQSFIDR